eukprot:364391-Chlamydomonas_euryale.AAC.5
MNGSEHMITEGGDGTRTKTRVTNVGGRSLFGGDIAGVGICHIRYVSSVGCRCKQAVPPAADLRGDQGFSVELYTLNPAGLDLCAWHPPEAPAYKSIGPDLTRLALPSRGAC